MTVLCFYKGVTGFGEVFVDTLITLDTFKQHEKNEKSLLCITTLVSLSVHSIGDLLLLLN